jgi:hypothetical protein
MITNIKIQLQMSSVRKNNFLEQMMISGKKSKLAILFFFAAQFFLLNNCSQAQSVENFDESKVGNYRLPELLITDDGTVIKSRKEWESKQRPEIFKKFTDNVYGRIPGKPKDIHYRINYIDNNALGGKATRKEVTIYFTKDENGPAMNLLLYLPNRVRTRVPIFVGLNFDGNHAVQADSGIIITENWKRANTKNPDFSRGKEADRWPVKEIIANGYGVGTAFYGDLEPDNPEGWKIGIRGNMQQELNIQPEEWGAISAWAWGLSRILDYLQTDKQVDAKKVVLAGHSRLGKTALWAGANDQRFAIVVSNESGEGGAALARRKFGETVERINTSFPHWFIDKYKTYNKNVDQLPVDQHMLLALIAPRPLYVASAVEDTWSDPKGEFLSAKYAGAVYALYGKKGLGVEELPAIEKPVGEMVRYHIRNGKHSMTVYDWQQYIQFANKHFKYRPA